jgi:hypothetical protein
MHTPITPMINGHFGLYRDSVFGRLISSKTRRIAIHPPIIWIRNAQSGGIFQRPVIQSNTKIVPLAAAAPHAAVVRQASIRVCGLIA